MAWTISRTFYEHWNSSQAQEVESSAGICLESSAFAPSNTTPTPDQFYWPDKTTEHSRLSRFGMTCVPLTADHGQAVLTWFLEGFPAKIFPPQEKVQDLKENVADSGEKCDASLAKYDPVSCEWKIAQCSFLEEWRESLEIFPRWGLMRGGELFHVLIQVEYTYENACGLSLPTPRSCTAMAARITENTANAKFPNLETVLARLSLPTLGANEAKGSSRKRYIGSPDFRGAKMSEGLRTCETDPIYLNPLFAELVMMWPLGWTDLKPLETAKFQEWQQQHGES